MNVNFNQGNVNFNQGKTQVKPVLQKPINQLDDSGGNVTDDATQSILSLQHQFETGEIDIATLKTIVEGIVGVTNVSCSATSPSSGNGIATETISFDYKGKHYNFTRKYEVNYNNNTNTGIYNEYTQLTK